MLFRSYTTLFRSKQKTAYEISVSDWSSDVCSTDLIFADVDLASDFQPSENSHSLSSQEVYGGAIASTSTSLSAASFTAYLDDGIADPLAQLESEELFFKFFPDRYRANVIVEQGKLGMSRSYPAGGKVQGDFTISPEKRGMSVTG